MLEYIILAILQGLVEWLPISSKSQIMIVSIAFLGISAPEAFSLAIFMHLGTALAALTKFRREFYGAIKACFPNPPKDLSSTNFKMRNWIIIATIGTALTAMPLFFFVEHIFEATPMNGDFVTLFIATLLIVTGIILLTTKRIYGKKRIESEPKENVNKQSFISGLLQGIAILPGISRSAMTVSANLFGNYDREEAVRLSFIMSVPAVLAAIAVDYLFGEYPIFGIIDPVTFLIVTLVTFLVGYFMMDLIIRFARKIQFGYFCIAFGVIAFILIVPFLFH